MDDRILGVLPQNLYEIRQKSIDDPSNLTHLEFRALDAFLWSITINRWRGLYELAERGLLEEEVWQRAVREDGPDLGVSVRSRVLGECKGKRSGGAAS
jgi:hypothetical protein